MTWSEPHKWNSTLCEEAQNGCMKILLRLWLMRATWRDGFYVAGRKMNDPRYAPTVCITACITPICFYHAKHLFYITTFIRFHERWPPLRGLCTALATDQEFLTVWIGFSLFPYSIYSFSSSVFHKSCFSLELLLICLTLSLTTCILILGRDNVSDVW